MASWSAIRATGQPFSRPSMLRPYVGGHRYGWTHYGVMIPDLPEPHRYFSTMIVAGLPGATAFDNDAAITTSPRDTATVSVSTAAPAAAMFAAYSMTEECHLEPDGSRLDFGGAVTIEGRYPNLQISTTATDFHAELRVTGTDQAAWFVRTPVYDHLSLCARYDGWITAHGERTEVATVGTFEYAASAGLHGLRDRTLGDSAKVPVDFFTYHVIAVDERTQLLLVEVHAAGEPVATMAYHRPVGGSTWVTHRGVRFEVTEYATTTTTDPFGNQMRLPVSFRWTAGRDLAVEGAVDTPPRFGVGRGYIVGYQCHGHFQGRPFESRGYMEYIDTEAADRAAPDFLARPG
ncbi:hypothetical protein A5635_19125 [Mycobacterium asiaticum]|uniref:AttH domain-containing protein n=1 Tax=Mycobacterium asiaticum TaxID=1790 RepID=A0A1A3NRA7_MYCAS|nr:hypothetical protein A5635_19125 [Mycobacterium asiaticum]